MADFITSITAGVTGVLSMLASVTTSLLANDLFAFGLAIMVTGILIGIVSKLVKRGRRG